VSRRWHFNIIDVEQLIHRFLPVSESELLTTGMLSYALGQHQVLPDLLYNVCYLDLTDLLLVSPDGTRATVCWAVSRSSGPISGAPSLPSGTPPSPAWKRT